MKPLRFAFSVVAIAAIASAVIGAQKKEEASSATASAEHKVFDPASLEWGEAPPALPPGAKFALLAGDPAKKGPFTIRLRMEAGYKIMPHTHPSAEHVTVISGTFHLGTGDKFDESAGHTMTAGTFTSMPAGMKHFAWSTDDTIIQVQSEGPFVIKYVNPADDPRNAKK